MKRHAPAGFTLIEFLVWDARDNFIGGGAKLLARNPHFEKLGGDPSWGVMATHGGKRSNYLFYDGHVNALRAVQTLTPVDLWDARPLHERRRYTNSEIQKLQKDFMTEYR